MKLTISKWIMVAACSATILAGCGTEDQVQTKQNSTTTSDRHSVHEYNQRRAYTLNDSSIRASDLSLRLSNEAERVYNVKEALVLIKGNQVIMSLFTKPDPLETQKETVQKVRERLLSKEPQLAGYQLYITTNMDLRNQILRVNNNMQNQNQAGYEVDHREPQFEHILQQVKKQSNR